MIPNLGGHVQTIYVEATPNGTEASLSRSLLHACPDLPADQSLAGSLLSLREGPALRHGRKLLLVVDQFEQWLHAPPGARGEGLVEALRQCDGLGVQTLLLVRDDFGMAAMRFMNAIEVPVVEGRNYATVDTFDVRHAATVLELFGRALETLPADGPLTSDQKRFLDLAAGQMAEEGRVAPVRLALFAEMFRGSSWNPATLKRVGGEEGLGVAFLESALGAATTNPRHRPHGPAARAVLKALLPDAGVNIKGHMRSDAELLAISGFAGWPSSFEDLLTILDGELRLIDSVLFETSSSVMSRPPPRRPDGFS